jgi:hypothetical protein
MARKVKYPMDERQFSYINKLAAERGLRWARPFDMANTPSAAAGAMIRELRDRFSLTHGLFVRDYIQTGIFEVVDEAKASKF